MTSPRPLLRAARGFTLIELLTVIAIIGILAAIIIPTVGRVRESARATVCKSNLRQLGLAAQLYGNERGFYPPSVAGGALNPSKETPGQVWVQFIRPYVSSTGTATGNSQGTKNDLGVCPSRTIIPASGEEFRTTYSVHPRVMPTEVDITATSSKKLVRMGSLARASQIILMADGAQQSHGGANSNFYSVTEADSTTTSGSSADQPIATTNDVDPAAGGYLRYRHSGDTINVVFVDGHAASFKKGEILARNVQIYY